jgi:transcription elongation factor Elf1
VEQEGCAVNKTLISFLRAELDRRRFVCKKCGTAVEISLGRVDKGPRPCKCHGCGEECRPLDADGAVRPDALSDLADAVRRIKEMRGLACEFIVQADQPEATVAWKKG